MDKVDELLLPVLAAYDQRQTQLRIDQFLSFNQRFAKIKSKRLQVRARALRPSWRRQGHRGLRSVRGWRCCSRA